MRIPSLAEFNGLIEMRVSCPHKQQAVVTQLSSIRLVNYIIPDFYLYH